MATLKQTLKYGLLRYPTIFPNPVDVMEHLFCITGNGFDWIDGELVDYFCEDIDSPDLTMKYPGEREIRYSELECMQAYNASRRLQDQAELLRMKFVEDNIETIINGPPINVYLGSRQHNSYYFIKGICLKYAEAFHFPDDIKEDWARDCMSS